MKKTYKILAFSLLLAFAFSCDQGDGRFGDNISTTGWIEFRSAASSNTTDVPDVIEIPLDINVPVFQQGINITYTVSAVEGDYTQFVNSTGGTIYVDPTNVTREATISFPFMNGDVIRCEDIVFDVTLVSEDVDGVGIGVDNDSNVTHRVTILRSAPESVPGTYFIGDYAIEDTLATVGPGNGTENFESGTVTLTVDPSNPNKRLFSASILPAFTGTNYDIAIEFNSDNSVQLDLVNSGIGCASSDYSYGPTDSPSSWDICNDLVITINYTEDPTGSCAGPYPASFTLTKL